MLYKLVLTFLIASVSGADEDRCSTPDNKEGRCIPLRDCEEVVNILFQPRKTVAERNFLIQSRCKEDTVSVCCAIKSKGCTTPDGYAGTCVSPHHCPKFVNAIRQTLSPKKIAYFLQARCTVDHPITMCCRSNGSKSPVPDIAVRHPPHGSADIPEPVPSTNTNHFCSEQMTAFPPDPSSKCCGYDSTVGNKIIGGNATAIDEYPWMALIEYKRKDPNQPNALLCGGVLISNRYVLTAAHCIDPTAVKLAGQPAYIRLGEYDINNDGADCVTVEAGGLDCTEGAVRIKIKTLIVHPDYNARTHRDDIGLVRLQSRAPFTDFIRPICLPSIDITLKPPTRFTLYAAGWGATEEQKQSTIKLHVDLPYVNLTQCQSAYSESRINTPLWNYQLCAGGVTGKDTCKGDSGGPLMFENGKFFEVIGIVSFGPYPCAKSNIPAVYTKVHAYRDWINNTIY